MPVKVEHAYATVDYLRLEQANEHGTDFADENAPLLIDLVNAVTDIAVAGGGGLFL